MSDKKTKVQAPVFTDTTNRLCEIEFKLGGTAIDPRHEANLADTMKAALDAMAREKRERALFLELERAARHVTSKAMISITDHHDRAAWEAMRDAFAALDAFRKA